MCWNFKTITLGLELHSDESMTFALEMTRNDI